MAAKLIAIANMKGGVGKTTITVGLAETLAAGGEDLAPARVCVVDLDAQASASFSLAGDAILLDLIQSGRTIDAFMEDRILLGQERSLRELIQHEVGAAEPDGLGVSLLASSPSLRIIEREIIAYLSQQGRTIRDIEQETFSVLEGELNALAEPFDYVIFDCAPGISVLTEAALRAADRVIVPTVPDFISNLGLEAFCKTVEAVDRESGAVRLPWVLANRVRRTEQQLQFLEEMRAESRAEDAGFMMFTTEIPDSTSFEATTAWSGERLYYREKYSVDTLELLQSLAREV